MVDHRRTSQLKQELEHEEALLKNIKDKLVDQLQRLKVCEGFCVCPDLWPDISIL